MAFKIIMSVAFITVFFVRIVRPELNIDSTSIILLILAFVPWFIQYIKTLEINGIGKVELIGKDEKEKIEKKAADAGMIKTDQDTKGIDVEKYSFYNLRYTDTKLALAGLRIEIENTLRKIAQNNGMDVSRIGLGKMTNILSGHQLISDNERAIIYDITDILNKAVHSQLKEYQMESIDWVFDLGMAILESLNEKT